MNQLQAIKAIQNGSFDVSFRALYPEEPLGSCANRYKDLLEKHRDLFGLREVIIVSSPGRTELGGNHTDHNRGKVLAAAVHLDAVAVGSLADQARVDFHSEGFPPIQMDLGDLKPQKGETGRTEGLIRGVLGGFEKRGIPPGGFQAVAQSRVPPGSGLSSSASFELLLATLCNSLFAQGALSPLELALIGKEAENLYFGKPCGLMDQLTCAFGGACVIDFEDPWRPKVERVSFALPGYGLFLIDTGGSHADLTEDYASIPADMKTIAREFGAEALRQVEEETFIAQLPRLRGKASDRAILRALHFYQENERVDRMKVYLREGRTDGFLSLVRESGTSSWTLLQNCVPSKAPLSQPIPLALAWAGRFLGTSGAARVHGGGFAGTIQAYVPSEKEGAFKSWMEGLFGRGAVIRLQVREKGAILVNSLVSAPSDG